MRATRRFLVASILSITLAACSGGNGKSQQVQLLDPPAAPVVTVDADIKQLIFRWEAVANATHFRLLENPDGHSGFTQIGDDIASAELSVTTSTSIHLHDWVNALYLVQACNAGGCADSTQVSATDQMLDTIGYFKASNTSYGDFFGRRVALSGDGKTLAVGASSEDSCATGINGDQSGNSCPGAGAVYVFRQDGTGWYQQAYIKASNTDPGDSFGYTIALSADGSTLAVGASEDGSATGINGDQSDNFAERSGAVYLFRFNGTDWNQEAYIKASNTDPQDSFGYTIALSANGNTLAVGALGEDSSATGINGDQYDDNHPCATSGAVYVYRFGGTEWFQQSYIKASNTGTGIWFKQDKDACFSGDLFGMSVALSASGNALAVGAPNEDSSATGIDGDQSDANNDIEYNGGAAYTFTFDGLTWSQQAYIKPSFSHGYYFFGVYLALSADGNTLAVGAPYDYTSATGINDPPLSIDGDYGSRESGAVHLFRHDGNSWSQENYIKASNAAKEDLFGLVLALSADGSTLAVGAPHEDSSANGIGGDQFDDSAPRAGAAYVFCYGESGWVQKSYVKAPNSDTENLDGPFGDSFGSTVSLNDNGTVLAVGAEREGSSAIGINGDQADNSAEDSGAVYVY